MQHITPLTSQASSLIGRYVRIVKHHRRVGGRVGTVRDLFWKGNEPWVVVQLTSGLQRAVAYGWTDLPLDQCPRPQELPEMLPAGLLAMALYWRGMRARRSRRLGLQPQKT
jgi:hypothetical protein